MDSKERQTWVKILGKFDQKDLKLAAFALLGSGGYDNLRGSTLEERKISLLENLYLRDQLSGLLEFIQEARLDIIEMEEFKQLEPQAVSPKQSKVVEFVNRVNEIQYITNPYAPKHLIISAPAGYGKTQLLKTVRTQLQGQGWLCICIELHRRQTYQLDDIALKILEEVSSGSQDYKATTYTAEEYGYEIAHNLAERFQNVRVIGVLFSIDEAEALSKDTAEQFINKLVPSISEGLTNTECYYPTRFILSGRYIAELQQLATESIWQPYTMSPFSFEVVQLTVENFAANTSLPLSPKTKLEIASHMMYLTGGHPGCMAKMLQNIRPAWPPDRYFDRLYEQIVKPVIAEIREHIHKDLINIFDTLSVVRRFNSDLLDVFIQNGLIDWNGKPYMLEDELTKSLLITRKRGFLEDNITQRLLAVDLAKTNPERFARICHTALDFYKSYLVSSGINRPDIIAIETIFQTLKCCALDKDGCKEYIFEEIPTILDMLVRDRNVRDIMRSFQELLANDWELRFYFNYLLREDVYRELPYQKLLRIIPEFQVRFEVTKDD
jgi:hypothetical protein